MFHLESLLGALMRYGVWTHIPNGVTNVWKRTAFYAISRSKKIGIMLMAERQTRLRLGDMLHTCVGYTQF